MNEALTLTNSKGRVVFQAFKQDNGLLETKHEGGSGYNMDIRDVFLSGSCSWCDNPSCKVTGELSELFTLYCKQDEHCRALIPQIKQ
jgi:hypothetical protein